MAKKRKNKHGVVFENKIDLTQWDIPKIDYAENEMLIDFENTMQEMTRKATEKLCAKLKTVDVRIKKVASEAMRIAFEKEVRAYFWDLEKTPENIYVDVPDFSEGGYEITIDIRDVVRDAILNRCDPKTGYAYAENKKNLLKLANILDELSNELKTAVTPEN